VLKFSVDNGALRRIVEANEEMEESHIEIEQELEDEIQEKVANSPSLFAELIRRAKFSELNSPI
jgi:hypothetical protein